MTDYAQMVRLPDSEKERMCRALLTEFGVSSVKAMGNGELIHSCPLPFGQHKNGDRNPSASLNYKKLVFNCLGCQNSGSLVWFVATCRGETIDTARDWIQSNTIGGEMGLSALLQYFDSLYEKPSLVPMPRLDSGILEPWKVIHPYLTEVRGIPASTIQHFSVGWDSVSNRIIIPHFWRGNLVGWQSRRMVDDGTPKYKSTPDFPKGTTLFAHDPKQRAAVVVESPMSVLSKWGQGWHIEATFGASVTEQQVMLIAKHPQVILFFDNDAAGWKATQAVGKRLGAYSDVLVAANSYAADAADLDAVTYGRLIEEAVPFALWKPPTTLEPWKGQEHGDEEVRHRRSAGADAA